MYYMSVHRVQSNSSKYNEQMMKYMILTMALVLPDNFIGLLTTTHLFLPTF